MQRETNKNMNKEKPVQNRQKKENIQKKQGKWQKSVLTRRNAEAAIIRA